MTDQKSTSIRDIIIAGSIASTIITLALTEDAFASSRYYQTNVHEPSVELNMDTIESPYANDVQTAPLAPPRQQQKLVLTPPARDMAGQTVVIDSNAAPRVSGPAPQATPKTASKLPPIKLRPPQAKVEAVAAPKLVESDPVTAGLGPIPDDAPLKIKPMPAPQEIAEPIQPAPAQEPIVASTKPTRIIDTPSPTSAAAVTAPPVIETPKANVPEAVMAEAVAETQTRQMSSIFDVIDKSVDRLAGDSAAAPAQPKLSPAVTPKVASTAPDMSGKVMVRKPPTSVSKPAAPAAVVATPKTEIAPDTPVNQAISDVLRAQRLEAEKAAQPMPSAVAISEVPEPVEATAPSVVDFTPPVEDVAQPEVELAAPTFSKTPVDSGEPKVIKVEKNERRGVMKQGEIVWNMPDAAKDAAAVNSAQSTNAQDVPVKVVFDSPRMEQKAPELQEVSQTTETTDIAPVDLMAETAVEKAEDTAPATEMVKVRMAPGTSVPAISEPVFEPAPSPEPLTIAEPMPKPQNDDRPEVIALTKEKDVLPDHLLPQDMAPQPQQSASLVNTTADVMPAPVEEPFAVPFRITDNDKDRVSQPIRDDAPAPQMRVQAGSERFDSDLSDAVVFNTRIEPSDTAVRIKPQGLGDVKLAVDNMNKPRPAPSPVPAPIAKAAPVAQPVKVAAPEEVEAIEPVNLADLIPNEPEPAPLEDVKAQLPEVIVETERTAPAAEPIRMASAMSSAGDVSITFDGASKDLDNAAKDSLQSIVSEMIDNPDMSIQLRSYAASTDGSDSSSRRVALGRAIDVRKYLMDRNIRPTRVEVRALGDQTDRLPLDRIDVVFVK